MKRASYGIDSPKMVLGELVFGLAAVALALVAPHAFGLPMPGLQALSGSTLSLPPRACFTTVCRAS